MNTENKNNNQIPGTGNPANNSVVPNYNGQTSVGGQINSNVSSPLNVVVSQQPVPNGIPGGVSTNGIPAVSQQNLGNMPIGQAGVNNNAVVSTDTMAFSQPPQQNIGNTNANQNGVVNNSCISSGTVILGAQPESNQDIPPAPVPPKKLESSIEVLNGENKEEQHEVVEVLTSSFEKKEKVNLLTPEQKLALTKKREEAFKEKESYQPAPVSKFKRFMSIFVIIVLFAIVFFLPDINNYIAEIRNPSNKIDNTPITTGILKCNLDKVDDKYNLSYSYDFDFTNSKLDRLSYVQATTGDELVDRDELNQRLASCTKLKNMTSGLSGVKIVCSLSGGVLTEQQTINYKTLNHEQVTTAYIEAGGIFPEFATDTNIDMIERNMKASGYTCERVK